MGAFDDETTVVIPDPNDQKKAEAFRKKWKWDAHEQVILHGIYNAGQMEEVTNASVDSDLGGKGKKQGKITLKSGTGRIKLMECMIIDWTLTRNGQRIPLTPHAIRKLPHNYQTPILEACDEITGENLDEEEQEAFLTSLNGHTEDGLKTEKLHPLKS